MSSFNGRGTVVPVGKTIAGTSRADRLYGAAGNDLIKSLDGDDTVDAGAGNDTVEGGAGRDDIFGGTGDDFLDGGSGNDDIDGGSGNDKIEAGTGDDEVEGGSGDDQVNGGAGRDDIDGGSGNDKVDGGSGSDRVEAGSGNDVATYVAGENAGAFDFYDGGSGTDTLRLVLTRDEWLRPSVQADIQSYLRFLADAARRSAWGDDDDDDDGRGWGYGGDDDDDDDDGRGWGYGGGDDDDDDDGYTSGFQFTSFGLNASDFETLEVVVDGVKMDLRDQGVVLDSDAMAATEDAAGVAVNVLDGDSVPDVIRSFTHTQAAHGTLQLTLSLADPSRPPKAEFVYTPDAAYWQYLGAGQSGADTFTYTVTDADGDTSTATVTVTVAGRNDAPTAGDDAASANEDDARSLSASALLGNDTDPDNGAVLSVSAVGPLSARGARLSLVGGSVVYDASTSASLQALAAGVVGTDSFSYTVTDQHGATDTATVTVSVTGVNDAPDAVADAVTANEDDARSFAASLLLGNDTDRDNGAVLSVSAVGPLSARGASVSLVGGSVVYDASASSSLQALAAGVVGTDSFSYTVTDEHGATDTATVTVSVTGVNDVPDAVADAVTANEDDAQSFAASLLVGNDTDRDNGAVLSVSAVDAVSARGASVSLVGGSVVYDASASSSLQALAAGATGTDTFSYTLTDEHGATDTATVTVSVTGVDDVPDAGDDAAAANEDDARSFAASLLLGNDTDVDDGATLSVASVGPLSARGASVSLVGGNVVYDASASLSLQALAAGVLGTDTFTYTVADEHGGTDTATVTVSVTGINDVPDAVADAVTANEDDAQSFAASVLVGNDTDPDDGAVLSVSAVDAVSARGASVSLVGGSVVYDASASSSLQALAAGATGTDTFRYTLTDEHGATDTATVTVSVTGVNDVPDAGDDAGAANEDDAQTFAASLLLGNDTDVDDGATLSVASVGPLSARGASVSLVGGNVVYDASASLSLQALAAGAMGTDSFTYTVADENGGTDTATVTVSVTGINDVPDANGDDGAANEDDAQTIAGSLLLANDTDPDDGAVLSIGAVSATSARGASVSLVGGNVVYDASTSLSLQALAAGALGTDTFSYTITDEHGATDTATVTVAVTGINDAPVVTQLSGATAATAIQVAEGTAGSFLTVTATDIDTPVLSYAVGASPNPSYDNAFFTVDPGTGALRFVLPPDFEFTDPGNDDLYKVQVTVSDGAGGSALRDYFVRVTNVAEDGNGMNVAVFDNATYVRTSGGEDAESDNVQQALTARGYSVSTFTDFSAAGFQAALAGRDALVIPELHVAALAPVLSSDARVAIEQFVAGGGNLIVHGSPSGRDAALVNAIFGTSVAATPLPRGVTTYKTADADGTFADDRDDIPWNDSTRPWATSSLPAGALSIYEEPAFDASTVVAFGHGAGEVVFLAWDFFRAAPPPGTIDGGWLEVLASAARYDYVV